MRNTERHSRHDRERAIHKFILGAHNTEGRYLPEDILVLQGSLGPKRVFVAQKGFHGPKKGILAQKGSLDPKGYGLKGYSSPK